MVRARRPWLAALLSLAVPGLGQLYAGRGRRALLLFLLLPPVELAVHILAVAIPFRMANLVIPAALWLVLRALVARDAALTARTLGADTPVRVFSRWYSCVAALLLVVALNTLWAHAYRATLVEAYKISAGSMETTILRGERLLAVKWAYGWRDPLLGRVIFGARRPQRGELVVFRYPEDPSRSFLKRVIGLPGEAVEIRDKRVLIDGSPLDEPYARFLEPPLRHDDPEYGRRSESRGDNWGPMTVPPGEYFVLGDNRDNSRDSRYWGFVEQDDLLGRAALVYWSWDSSGGPVRWERIGRRLE
jgi:signal peptidase I